MTLDSILSNYLSHGCTQREYPAYVKEKNKKKNNNNKKKHENTGGTLCRQAKVFGVGDHCVMYFEPVVGSQSSPHTINNQFQYTTPLNSLNHCATFSGVSGMSLYKNVALYSHTYLLYRLLLLHTAQIVTCRGSSSCCCRDDYWNPGCCRYCDVS